MTSFPVRVCGHGHYLVETGSPRYATVILFCNQSPSKWPFALRNLMSALFVFVFLFHSYILVFVQSAVN